MVDTSWTAQRSRQKSLYPRQAEALMFLFLGCRTNSQIAQHMRISEHTVSSYIGGAMRFYGVHSRWEALRLAVADGQIWEAEIQDAWKAAGAPSGSGRRKAA